MTEPLHPIWQVVHRQVLARILHLATMEACSGGRTVECDRLLELTDAAEAGTLGVLTKKRWEGAE